MKPELHIQLITLATGERLLRLEDPESGLTLERKLHPGKPLVSQKARLLALFQAMLQNELAMA